MTKSTAAKAASKSAETSDITADELSWTDATKELQSILQRLDDDQVDVDEVADLVERAAQLVTICRTRLRGAGMRVDEALAAIEDDAE